ncbi:hypothetical protein LEP1GSC188_4531 [Leptospira weilii serovar Topaz str. LT2116]|uniref:Uncharacterized protein n=1 Tax=Leptospira weilii serovar Topaz str. LT2116 TaxID=1088540 RepID=M3H268_9LEPT|nr:hypothetical protein LEP1GSC188_4531 [Leptospira weilii serovar Topaz str. LT2116]
MDFRENPESLLGKIVIESQSYYNEVVEERNCGNSYVFYKTFCIEILLLELFLKFWKVSF